MMMFQFVKFIKVFILIIVLCTVMSLGVFAQDKEKPLSQPNSESVSESPQQGKKLGISKEKEKPAEKSEGETEEAKPSVSPKQAEKEKAETKASEQAEGKKAGTEELEQPEKEKAETEAPEKPAEGQIPVQAAPALKRFGYDFFAGARARILNMEKFTLVEEEKRLPSAAGGESAPPTAGERKSLPSAVIKDAISGFVGPVDMMQANVNAVVPHNHIIRPGDELTLIYWSKQTPPETKEIVVNEKGEVMLPDGSNIVVRDMTLEQFEEAVQKILSRTLYADIKLIATPSKLHTIQVFITGEAFRAGSYATSAVTTVFNALYMCGGPSDNGSLRDIRLLRGNQSIKINFYKYLMEGDSSQDVRLFAGDTIFIAPVGRLVTISGEVKRPGIYELGAGEKLNNLLEMAGGIRPSGFTKRVQIDSVRPNVERLLLDLDFSLDPTQEVTLYDGDRVMIFPILPEQVNTVTLEGKVKRPGVYQLKDGMRIANLISVAENVMGEAYLERADLFRLNDDKKTYTLIPINLGLALMDNEAHNILLKEYDRLVVYSKWDVQWIAKRRVGVQGAVQKPGDYERADNMKVSDLLLQAGGALPDAYLKKSLLFRLNERLQVAESIPIDLEEVLQQNPDANIALKDGDVLMVRTFEEVRWEPKREVAISGTVQKAGTYPRVDDMRVSALLFQAGGLMPKADNTALLLRRNERWEIAESIPVDLKAALEKKQEEDILLKDGDTLIVYTEEEVRWKPKREVAITGAVQNGGAYPRVDNMRVSDLLFRAGGPLPNAYLEKAELKRALEDRETFKIIPIDLGKVIAGDENANILLEDSDVLTVYTIREAKYMPEKTVSIYGAVQRPDIYMRTEGMRLSDLLFAAGGILPGARDTAEIARARGDGQTTVVSVDLTAVLREDQTQDILLYDGDIVSIPKKSEFRDVPFTVRIEGHVKYPGTYALEKSERLSDLIERAGGLTERAFPEGAIFIRKKKFLIGDEQEKSLKAVWKNLDAINQDEYIRELAKSQLERKQAQQTSETTEAIAKTAAATVSPLSAPIAAAAEELMGEKAETQPSAEQTELSAPIATAAEELIGEKAKTQPGAEQTGLTETTPKAPEERLSMPRVAGTNLVTPARKIEELIPNYRVFIDLKTALQKPGGNVDISLEDGDVITIPARMYTLLVTGAVMHPGSFYYQPEMKVEDYIDIAGGYARDANKDDVYVLKANGLHYQSKKVKKIEPGDVIIVPTKVMVEKVTDRWGQVFSIIKITVVTVASIYLVKLLVD
jgi:protein involved in polysaccharide export with SLBB domain